MNQRWEEKLQLHNHCIRELNCLYRNAALGFRLSESEFWILYALSNPYKEYSQQSLCNEWFLPKQTVNSSIKCLLKKNLVYLEHVCFPHVKRQKVIHLTPEGKSFIAEKIENFKMAEWEAFSHLTEQEQDTFISLIQKQTYNLKKATNL